MCQMREWWKRAIIYQMLALLSLFDILVVATPPRQGKKEREVETYAQFAERELIARARAARSDRGALQRPDHDQ